MERKRYIEPGYKMVILEDACIIAASNNAPIVTMPDGNEAIETDPNEKQMLTNIKMFRTLSNNTKKTFWIKETFVYLHCF